MRERGRRERKEIKRELEVKADTRGGDKGSNLCGVSTMPDVIHHSFDEERP